MLCNTDILQHLQIHLKLKRLSQRDFNFKFFHCESLPKLCSTGTLQWSVRYFLLPYIILWIILVKALFVASQRQSEAMCVRNIEREQPFAQPAVQPSLSTTSYRQPFVPLFFPYCSESVTHLLSLPLVPPSWVQNNE